MPFQRPIVPLVLGGAVPALVRSIVLLPRFDLAGSVIRLIVVVLLAIWIGFVIAIYRARVQPLRSIANLLEALHAQRFEALEASALLHKVLAEIDVAVLAFDGEDVIRLTNRAAGETTRLMQVDPCHLARVEQFACADQVGDRNEP